MLIGVVAHVNQFKALLGHSRGALLFNRNFSSLILRWSSDATPHRGTPGCTRTHLPTPACTHPRACMSVSSASASHTGTQDIGVQAGTHEGGSSTNKLYKLYTTNIPIQHICRTLLRMLLRTQSYQWISAIHCTISNPDNRCNNRDQAVLCATYRHCPLL